MRGLDREIADAERQARAGQADPAGLARLGQLYLRAGRPEDARGAFERARAALPPLVAGPDGELELTALWTEVNDGLTAAEAALERAARLAERAALVARLEAGGLEPALHDALVRLEVALGLPLHPEPRRCPACLGPLADDPAGGVRCARSGRGADLCRHTDARDLYACAGCGLVVRAWGERKGRFKPGEHEPPLGRVARPRCPFCQGPVASWPQHLLRCPRARPGEFPVCGRCRKRGVHEASVRCPRCDAEVATAPCLELPAPG